jgi:N utilization substance protein A
VQELRGEKIDIVLWDPDVARFVCNAIAPAQVAKVIVLDKKHSLEVIVPDDQLSLSIGRKGQNVRLAAELTGWNIDVFSESRVEELARMAKEKLVAELDIADSMATILYSHAFRSVEEIAETPEKEFMSIPGVDPDSLKAIFAKARAHCGVPSAQPVEDSAQDDVSAPTESAAAADGE